MDADASSVNPVFFLFSSHFFLKKKRRKSDEKNLGSESQQGDY